MRTTSAFVLASWLFVPPPPAVQPMANRALEIHFIDTEGGQATLYVAPSGQSVLVDTGFPGDRDTDRIIAALDRAGVKALDYLLITHYHLDHAGGVQDLAKRIPIHAYVDHGPTVEQNEQVTGFQQAYARLYAKATHIVVKPGDKLPIAGLDWQIVTAAGKAIVKPLSGAGQPNSRCAGFKPQDGTGPSENAQSVGSVVTLGKFRTINLGDLLWNNEFDLMCPSNKVGPVDLYVTSHHGLAQSGSAALVHGLHPRVAIMNNGTRKGGSVDAFQTLHTSPGLEDLWLLHWSHNGGTEHNPAGVFIANVEEPATLATILTSPASSGRGGPSGGRGNAHDGPAYGIRVSAQPDGTFTVTNTRNGFSKTYYHAVQPPSTNSALPVTYEEASDARKSAAPAISSSSPHRPIGIRRTNS